MFDPDPCPRRGKNAAPGRSSAPWLDTMRRDSDHTESMGPRESAPADYTHTQRSPLCLILYAIALACAVLAWGVHDAVGSYVAVGVGLLLAFVATACVAGKREPRRGLPRQRPPASQPWRERETKNGGQRNMARRGTRRRYDTRRHMRARAASHHSDSHFGAVTSPRPTRRPANSPEPAPPTPATVPQHPLGKSTADHTGRSSLNDWRRY